MFHSDLSRRKFSATANGTCEEDLKEKVGSWNFVEHSRRSYCSCSRSVTSHVDVYVMFIYVCPKSFVSFSPHTDKETTRVKRVKMQDSVTTKDLQCGNRK